MNMEMWMAIEPMARAIPKAHDAKAAKAEETDRAAIAIVIAGAGASGSPCK
jgi:NADH dehydrogenase FAD-containing subunit